MEQFRHIGEVLGSLNALMVLQDDTRINQHQCGLLLDIFKMAFNTIAEAIRMNLKLEEKNTKWKALDQPLRELHFVFKEGELYVRQCLDAKDWWGKAISLHQNKDCVEFHIHNLLSYFFAVIEAIETAGEISGLDQDELQKRMVVLTRKYDREWNDPKLFQWRFGKEYLVPKEICHRFDIAWREDRWLLVEALREKKSSGSATKNEQRLGDMLLKKLIGSDAFNGKLFPSSILVGAKDYQVKRRLGGGNQYKEIHWLGENFALRHFFGEVDQPLNTEISTLLSLSHPNILQYLCGFYDGEKKECFLVMELVNKDLSCYIRENCSQKRRILFSLPVVVDLLLQIARGMEYLHSQKIYHGDLNPSNVLLKARNYTEGYFHAKITGYGLSSVKNHHSRKSPTPDPTSPIIWFAPEVLVELEQPGIACNSKHTEKADVYSFGMLCFELLTGKVPFEDRDLEGDKPSRNIRAGERPLFPYPSPKYLVNLTKKCWQTNPALRPSFSSICRILRYIKKFLVMHPDHDEPGLQLPFVDYCETEARFLKKFSGEDSSGLAQVSQIPFQMFSYRLLEKEKTSGGLKGWEAASDAVSVCRDETVSLVEGPSPLPPSDVRSVCSEAPAVKKMLSIKKFVDVKVTSIAEDPVSPESDARSVSSDGQEMKILPTKKSTVVMKARKGPGDETSTAEDQFIPAIDARSLCFDGPDRKILSTKKSTYVMKGRKGPDDLTSIAEDQSIPASDARSLCSEAPDKKILSMKKIKKSTDVMNARKGPATQQFPRTPKGGESPRTPKGQSPRPLWNPCSRSRRVNSDRHLALVTSSMSPSRRKARAEHVSDSEMS